MARLMNLLLKYKVFMIFNFAVLLMKIFYSYTKGFEGLTFEDWDIANNLVKYGVYSEFMTVGPTAYKLPVYPLFLSLFIYIFGENAKTAVIISQHFIFFLVPLLFILIARLFNKEKTGILTGYLFILSPAYFIYSNTLEITNIFIFIFLIFLYYFLVIWQGKHSYIHIIMLGISASVLFLSQVIAVPLSMILLLSLLIFKKIKLKEMIIVLGIISCLYSPWVIRNYITFDRIIISKTPVWQNIHFGYFHDLQVFPSLQKISPQKSIEIRRKRMHTDEFTMEKIYEKEVKEIEQNNPCISLKKAAANALMLWYVPSRYFYDSSPAIIGRKIYVIVLNIVTLLSLVQLYRNKNWQLLLFSVLLFGNFTAPYMIGQAGMTRFKLDFEWYQLFLAACLIYSSVFNNNKKETEWAKK